MTPWRTVLTALALFTALVGGGARAAPPAKSFGALRRAGQQAYRANKFDQAEALFRRASSLRPEEAEVWLDLAMSLQHLGRNDDAIAANRRAIRLASKKGDARSARAQRTRRASYFNLGKLSATHKLEFPNEEGSCLQLPSDLDCRATIFACGRTSAWGTAEGHQDYTIARFAPDEPTARADDEGGVKQVLETYPEFGASPEQTRDASDGDFFDVTLSFESHTRQTVNGEVGVEVAGSSAACSVVHVDGCAGRLGLYCEWQTSSIDEKDRSKAAAVELTFSVPP